MNIQALQVQTPQRMQTSSVAAFKGANSAHDKKIKIGTDLIQGTLKGSEVLGRSAVSSSQKASKQNLYNTWQAKFSSLIDSNPADFLPKDAILKTNFSPKELQEMTKGFRRITLGNFRVRPLWTFNREIGEIRATISELLTEIERKADLAKKKATNPNTKMPIGTFDFVQLDDRVVMRKFKENNIKVAIQNGKAVIDVSPECEYTLIRRNNGTIDYRSKTLNAHGSMSSMDITYNDKNKKLVRKTDGSVVMSTIYCGGMSARTINMNPDTIQFSEVEKRDDCLNYHSITYNKSTEIDEVKDVMLHIPTQEVTISTIKYVPDSPNARLIEKSTLNRDGELISYGKYLCKNGLCLSAETFEV